MILCYCKKDFYSLLDNKLFEKGKLYEIRFETVETIWVIYNENGNCTSSGCRFHNIKNKNKVYSLHNFYHFFMTERASKLKMLQNTKQE